MTVTKSERRLISRRFRGRSPDRLAADFGSIGWAVNFGKASVTKLVDIRDHGYSAARQHFDFYSDKRVAHGASRRAVRLAETLAAAKPYYIAPADDDRKMIMALNWIESVEKGKPVYWPMKAV